MNQQINLYQPIFRKQKAIFSALAMLQVWGIVVVVMAAISGYTAFSLARLEQQIVQGQKIRNVTQGNVDRLKARQLALTPSKLLDAEVKRTRAELEARRQVAALLGKGSLSNIKGFSPHFEGLARRHVAGAWLTEISLREGGIWVNLRGVALQPEVVPSYLESLLGAEAFARSKFNTMQLQAAPDPSGRVWFEVGTAEKDPGAPLALGQQPVNRSQEDAVVGITRRAN